MSIRVSEITKRYGTQTALNKISFSVEKGEVVGFLGPNGAGKSTLMKILTTYISSDEGSAWVGGSDVIKNPEEVRKVVGYLPEHNPLYLDLYVREYLAFSASVFNVKKSRVEEVIELTGLTAEAQKKIGQLSKGYRQRVGLANALLHNPEVLILDEPTTGLDPNQLIEIRELIRNIGKDKTVFLSTHIMQEVEAVCDRVIIINKGNIVADAKLNELKDSEHQIIEVEFDLRVEEELLKTLPDLVLCVNTFDFVWELTFSAQKDMRSVVFDFAQDNGLKTLRLSQKNKNLESIFRQLTSQS